LFLNTPSQKTWKFGFEFTIFKGHFANILVAGIKFVRYIKPNFTDMSVFGVVIALFILAIVSVWAFPNSKVSDNEHDIKH